MHIRQAQPEEAAIVASVLGAAAHDLLQKGQALWGAAEVREEAVNACRGEEVSSVTTVTTMAGDAQERVHVQFICT